MLRRTRGPSIGFAAKPRPCAGSRRSAPARSFWRRRAYSPDSAPRRTGNFAPVCSSNIRTSVSIPIRSICTMTGFGHPRGSLLESISAWRWCRRTSDARLLCRWHATSSSFSIVPAASRSSAPRSKPRRWPPTATRQMPSRRCMAGSPSILPGDLRVERLAEQAGMSPRTFARIYAAKMRLTPARMVEKIRVEAVRRSLEETDLPIKRIASMCGFGQEERLRRAFARQVGTTPAEYRRRF